MTLVNSRKVIAPQSQALASLVSHWDATTDDYFETHICDRKRDDIATIFHIPVTLYGYLRQICDSRTNVV